MDWMIFAIVGAIAGPTIVVQIIWAIVLICNPHLGRQFIPPLISTHN